MLRGSTLLPSPWTPLVEWDSQAVKLIGKLGRPLARHTGKEDSETIVHTFQPMSILLMLGNAALLLRIRISLSVT